MVDYSSLENCRTERCRGFESLSLRNIASLSVIYEIYTQFYTQKSKVGCFLFTKPEDYILHLSYITYYGYMGSFWEQLTHWKLALVLKISGFTRIVVNLGGLDILHGKTCYNRLICIYL